MSTVATGRVESIPADSYHADPADTPSLSASIAHILCTSTPRHAWTAHPRLNPDFERDHDPKYDVGTASHAILLEGRDCVHVVDAPDWRTNAAKDERDKARRDGRIPLLADTMADVERMVEAGHYQIAIHKADPPLLAEGKPEQTLIWEEDGGVVCRARFDWLRDDHTAADDIKTTSRSANPESWSRSLFGMGFDLRAAFYLRGLEAVTGKADAAYRFVVIETSPPHALSVVELGPDAMTIGRKKCAYAIDLWRRCLTENSWPGYPDRVCYAGLPPWEEASWLAREERELA